MLTEFYKEERVPLEKAFGKAYPSYFLDPDAEYQALVHSCGVIDLTHWRILRAQGKDVTEVIVKEDVAVDGVSHDHGVLGVEGPKAKDVIYRLLGAGRLPKSPLAVVEREFEDFTILVIQNSATGEPGYHVRVPAGEVLRIRNYLVQAARGSDGLPVGLAVWKRRRTENGLAWY